MKQENSLRDNVLESLAKILRKWERPQCYLVALLLSSQFKGTIWYNNDHCITEIGGVYYDKSGVVYPDLDKDRYLPIEDFGINIKARLIEALIEKHK